MNNTQTPILEFMSKVKFELYNKLMFQSLKKEFPTLAGKIVPPTQTQLNDAFESYSNPDNSSVGSYKHGACILVNNTIDDDGESLPLKLGEAISSLEKDVNNSLKALSNLFNECEGTATTPIACQFGDALIDGGYEVTDNVFSANGQAYMTEEAMTYAYNSLGGTNSNFELTDEGLTYKNGECVVRIEVIAEVNNTHPLRPNRTVTGNIIEIQKRDGNWVPLHEYPLTTSEERKDVLRVIWEIVKPMDIGPYLYMIPYIKDGKSVPNTAAAFYSPEIDRIFINRTGGINSMLSNKFNLINVMYHEKLHRDDPDKKISSFLEHALVYFGQMEHSSFLLTTEDFKKTIIGAFSNRLLNHFNDIGVNQSNISIIHNTLGNFNNLGLEYTLYEFWDGEAGEYNNIRSHYIQMRKSQQIINKIYFKKLNSYGD